MVLTVDFRDNGDVVYWTLTDDGVTNTVDEEYTPTVFVGDAAYELYGRRGGATPTPPDRDDLSDSLARLQAFLDVKVPSSTTYNIPPSALTTPENPLAVVTPATTSH